MKRYIRSDTNRGLNEEERDYLYSKLIMHLQSLLGDYYVDDIYVEGNRIAFTIFDEHGNPVTDQYIWAYRPDGDDGPEEQLDEWLDDFEYALPSKYKR